MIIHQIKKLIRKVVPEYFILCFWHFPRAFLVAALSGFPAKNLKLIGVAGTKGKTTTCHLISQILERADKKVAMISTTLIKITQREELNKIKMTTPSPFFLQRFIKKAVMTGCEYLVLETSSHALTQYRLFGIPFEIVVLTNMMPDHLDYHKTKEGYVRSHQKMFSRRLKYLILNADDPNLAEFFKMPLFSGQKILYSLEKSETIAAKNILFNLESSSFLVKTPKESLEMNLPLLGRFNIYNALASIAVAFSQNIPLKTVRKTLKEFKGAPGRMEKIDGGQDFEVIVDYAHSPDSLISLFEAISPLKKNHIITVFGACGERDASQRPRMGEIISQNSDYVIITNDDPYSEDPEKIANEVMLGIKNKNFSQNLWKILDRKSAIEKAISLAQKDDLVLILGKGAEQWQVFKDKKIPWDDRKIAKEIISKNVSPFINQRSL
jgi:UDP-N-acetylmuramoyl-L-alanyl-D-glutamate--2,6-diaminopimelate ligase